MFSLLNIQDVPMTVAGLKVALKSLGAVQTGKKDVLETRLRDILSGKLQVGHFLIAKYKLRNLSPTKAKLI